MGNETNLTCNITSFTREQVLHFKDYSWWVETLGNLCCGCVGLFLNSITIHVFSSPALRKNFFNRLLICLAIFDSLYITCEISEVFRHRYNTVLQQYIFVSFVYPIRNIFMLSSIYMTVILAFERYQAITDPVQYRIRGVRTSMNQQLLTHLLPGVIFAVIYYIPRFFELYIGDRNECNYHTNKTLLNDSITTEETPKIDAKENCTPMYGLMPTSLRTNPLYVFWYIIVSNLTVTAFLPLCVLTFLNCRIITSLRKFAENKRSLRNGNTRATADSPSRRNSQPASSSSTDVKKTFILFSIVVLFAICHSLRVTFNIDEFIINMEEMTSTQICRGPRLWAEYLQPINPLLIILNSSLNFFIYALFDTGFQEALRKRLKMNQNTPICQTEETQGHRLPHSSKATNANKAIELVDKNLHKV